MRRLFALGLIASLASCGSKGGYPGTTCKSGWGLFDGVSCHAELTPTLRLRYMETRLDQLPHLASGRSGLGYACYDVLDLEACPSVVRVAWEGRRGRSPLLFETESGDCYRIATPREEWPSSEVADCEAMVSLGQSYDLTPIRHR